VAVSGGADSVALFHLLRLHRPELTLHIVHLDHETRGGASGEDAAFVERLARAHGVACSTMRRSEIEPALERLSRNQSARFRALRLELFRRVVADHALGGVLLAHHADDQAETVLQRLLRGSGAAGLTGMSAAARVGGVLVLRPLLSVRRAALRAWLGERDLAWREDASNQSPLQQRNRVRAMLAGRDDLVTAALELADRCVALSAWLRKAAEGFNEAEIELAALRRLAPPIARAAARRWLCERSGAEISPAAVDRLLLMACDAASPARQQFPGGVMVRRRGGKLFTERTAPSRERSSPDRRH
jgi:tRNA(Ile)-lysidine synthetase-like protein